MRSKNWKLARACASPALRRLCLISMMTIDRPETAAEFFARRSKGRAVGDLDRILDKVHDRPPEPGDELKAGRPIAYIAGNRRGCREIRARDLARHVGRNLGPGPRSEEQTTELQSLMRITCAVFGLKNKNTQRNPPTTHARV